MRRHDRGSATVELVIATPLLGLLLMLVIQYALWAHASHVARAAANSGLQTTRVYGGTIADGTAETTTMLDQLGRGLITDETVSVTRTATVAAVTVRGRAPALLPGLTMPIDVTVSSPVERTSG